jgi:hypothetical protein
VLGIVLLSSLVENGLQQVQEKHVDGQERDNPNNEDDKKLREIEKLFSVNN